MVVPPTTTHKFRHDFDISYQYNNDLISTLHWPSCCFMASQSISTFLFCCVILFRLSWDVESWFNVEWERSSLETWLKTEGQRDVFSFLLQFFWSGSCQGKHTQYSLSIWVKVVFHVFVVFLKQVSWLWNDLTLLFTVLVSTHSRWMSSVGLLQCYVQIYKDTDLVYL